MAFHLPDDRIPKDDAWRNREFLEWAYHKRGLSPRAIAYKLGVSKSHVTVHIERLGYSDRGVMNRHFAACTSSKGCHRAR